MDAALLPSREAVKGGGEGRRGGGTAVGMSEMARKKEGLALATETG